MAGVHTPCLCMPRHICLYTYGLVYNDCLLCLFAWEYLYVCLYRYISTSIYIYICVYIFVFIHIRIGMYICMYVSMCKHLWGGSGYMSYVGWSRFLSFLIGWDSDNGRYRHEIPRKTEESIMGNRRDGVTREDPASMRWGLAEAWESLLLPLARPCLLYKCGHFKC